MALDITPAPENQVPVLKNASTSALTQTAVTATALADDRQLGDNIQVSNTSTNTVSIATAGSNIAQGASGTANKPTIKQRENKLHDYVNWTYKVGWYMLDIAAFNDFVTTGNDSPSLRKHPIFVSGGFKENEASGLDFDLGLESLRLSGVVGNNRFSPNANQFDIEMEVVEPFGVSLLTKLRMLAQSVQSEDREFQLPYLLDIRWLGYDDKGQIQTNIPDTGPKLIAVQIVNLSFNITAAGTKYRIIFAPYAQLPLSNTIGSIRADTRLYGGTLEEVLRTGEESLKARLNALGDNDKKEGRAEYPDTYDFEIKSFSGDGRTEDNKLATAPLTFPVKGGSIVMETLKDLKSPDPTKQYWHNTAASNIKDIVSDLARNSKYFQDKITDPTPAGENTLSNLTGSNLSLPQQTNFEAKHAAMELIKIIPMIKKIGPYDSVRGVFQKDIVYKVVPYFLYGQANPRTGQATVASRGFVKEYNWLFTGKNKDVFNVDLTYDNLYYRLFQTAVGPKGRADTVSETEESDKAMVQAKPGGSAATYVSVAGDINARTNKGDKPNAVQEYFEQQLNPSYGSDLTEMTLDIIGDPDWIPQDRSIRPVGTSVDSNNNGYVDGELAKGISVDVDGVYVNINFRTPSDYSDKTGLMQLSDDSALISGFYQVYMIDSEFDHGKFTQKLHLVRVQTQEKNIVKKGSAGLSGNTTGVSISNIAGSSVVTNATGSATGAGTTTGPIVITVNGGNPSLSDDQGK